MNKKEFTKHYINILHCPDLEKYPERTYDLKDEIQQLSDIDKIPYRVALNKIYSVCFRQYSEADPDSNYFRDTQKATINLSFLIYLEGSGLFWLRLLNITLQKN